MANEYPTDLAPILEAIADRAARLCESQDARIFVIEENGLRYVAGFGEIPFPGDHTLPLIRGLVTGRAAIDRAVVHIEDMVAAAKEFPESQEYQRRYGYRTTLAVPLVRGDKALGVILMRRSEVRPYDPKHIELVKAFADQAAVAIENLRLSSELKTRNAELSESLEQQTATAEILKVISSSPTDIQPVLDAVAESAARLCGASDVIIRRVDGDVLRVAAHFGPVPVLTDVLPITRNSFGGRALLERRTIHIHDTADESVQADFPASPSVREGNPYRTILVAPLLRENTAIGVISMRRPEMRPFSDNQVKLFETFAAQAAIAIENVRLFNETKEALEQQTATAEILKVISSSPTDIQPVLIAVAESAARLCEANDVIIRRVDGDTLRLVAHVGPVPVSEENIAPSVSRRSIAARVVRERRTMHIHDVLEPHVREEYPEAMFLQHQGAAYRTMLLVPLLRENTAIGTIGIRRLEVRPFAEKQIKLLETFAAQAAIAIENVRLFNETKEALEQQTATAEILKVISNSPTDVQPVFDAIVETGVRLFGGLDVVLRLVKGDQLVMAASTFPADPGHEYSMVLDGRSIGSQAVLTREVMQSPDVTTSDWDWIDETVKQNAIRRGIRAVLVAPMLRENVAVGTIVVTRATPGVFGEKQVAVLKTFADQAVIAIENVRLFNETKEALEQQTVISEILRVISSSPTDTQPVFDAIVRSSVHLFGSLNVALRLIKGDRIETVASTRPLSGPDDKFSVPLDDDRFPAPRAILHKEVVQVPDFLSDDVEEWVGEEVKQRASSKGYRALMTAPMLREGKSIGAITVDRATPGLFTDKQVALLRTFADQAVIAIENVRLFNETKEALERQTATAEILKVISSSLTDTQPVFDAIVQSGVRLFDGLDVRLRIARGDRVETVASSRGQAGPRDAFSVPLNDDRYVAPRAMLRCDIVHVPEIDEEEWPDERMRQRAKEAGWHAILCAPMLRENNAIGAIAVSRAKSGAFTDKEIALLKTFASQAVIAIENVRLFKELQARNAEITEALEQQTATSEILSVISSSPTDVMPVLDAVTHRAAQLCDAPDARLFLVDGDAVNYITGFGQSKGAIPRRPLHRGFVVGRAILDQSVVHIEDIVSAFDEFPDAREPQREFGNRTMLAVPLVREGKAFGAILMRRKVLRPFTHKQISLLKTFADQAVIAIENVRLFNETKEALEQQTVISEILRVISSSPTDTQPVFDAIVRSGLRLFGGSNVSLRLVKGDYTEIVAGTLPGLDTRGAFRIQLDDESVPSVRSVRRREFVHVPDILAAEWISEHARDRAKELGFRAIMCAPMLRENHAVGSINVFRAAPGSFTEKQVTLLKTFADQAVIAIENVRLFNETKEALEQQTVISEILRVISSSPTDVQPVFDAIVKSGLHIFGGSTVSLRLVKGDHSERVASTSAMWGPGDEFIVPLDDESFPSSRAMQRREVVQIPDALVGDWVNPRITQRAEQRGYRALMVAPLLRENRAIGTINVNKKTPGLFTEKQVALLKTFADQAVIAIENVRLFKELQARNAEITESLEQQTATAEILKVISSSPTDIQPVFDTILEKATRLCDAHLGLLGLYDGEKFEMVAHRGANAEYAKFVRERGPFRPLLGGPFERMISERQPIHIEDRKDSLTYRDRNPHTVAIVELGGARTYVAVPMLKEGRIVGAISIYRPVVQPFTQKQIDLVSTFASQAVIAIENVRLFKELQARNADITEALQQQTATSEILQVISGSPTDVTPVLETVARNAAQLCDTNDARVYVTDGDALRYVGGFGDLGGAYLTLPLTRKLVVGRTVIDRTVVHIEDLAAVLDEFPDARGPQQSSGTRTTLAVPLMRENQAFGAILMRRTEVRPFTEKQIELVKTFAYQAAIGIENVRLFKEIQEKGRQLEVANKHKSEFLANMSHELRTPLNAVIGFSEALIEKMFGELNAKQEDYLRDIHSSGRHLLSLINDILDLSKIEAGRMELELSEFYLPAALKNAMTLVRERAQTHGIEMKLHMDPKLGDIRADERKVKQIVLNLLSNAVKFTPDGGCVEVDARQNGDVVKVSVKDTGVGIASKDQVALFEEFRQVGRSSTGKREGTGLGLALARRFVELHGGTIGVESKPGKGSTFTFALPLKQVKQPVAKSKR